MAKLIKNFVNGINKSSKNKTISNEKRFERFVEDFIKYSDYHNFNV